jgi:hypothetical protein
MLASESLEVIEDCLIEDSDEDITPSAIVKPKILLSSKRANEGQPQKISIFRRRNSNAVRQNLTKTDLIRYKNI